MEFLDPSCGWAALALTVLTMVAAMSVATALPAAAAGAPTIANGFAGYTPGSTSPPNQFNALTLVSGGAASVNTASLTIVTQPSSGSATASATAYQRDHHLHAGRRAPPVHRR